MNDIRSYRQKPRQQAAGGKYGQALSWVEAQRECGLAAMKEHENLSRLALGREKMSRTVTLAQKLTTDLPKGHEDVDSRLQFISSSSLSLNF